MRNRGGAIVEDEEGLNKEKEGDRYPPHLRYTPTFFAVVAPMGVTRVLGEALSLNNRPKSIKPLKFHQNQLF